MKEIIKELGFTALLVVFVAAVLIGVLRPLTTLPDVQPTTTPVPTEPTGTGGGGDVHTWDLDGNPIDDPFVLREEENVLLVIMYFFNSSCVHCEKHIAVLNEYHAMGYVEVVGFANVRDKNTPQAIKDWGIEFPVYYTDQQASATPYTMVIAWNGETGEWQQVVERVGAWDEQTAQTIDEWAQEAHRLFLAEEE